MNMSDYHLFIGKQLLNIMSFCSFNTFENVRFDTMYQAFFCAFIWVRFSYVLDIINKDSSNNDIFYNECVFVIVLFAKRFERVVSAIKRYTRWFQRSNYTKK